MPTFEEKILARGGIELHRPKAAPDVAPANSARVYYDADQGALQVSNNGGAYSGFADLTAAGVTATATEINKLHGVVAGASPASKVAVLGTNKNLDVLALPVSGLKIGAGAGTAVDATAAELNRTAGVTPGTATVSKALVIDSSGDLTGVRFFSTSGGTLGATGANQAGAAPIITENVAVTGSDDAKGVLLPIAEVGRVVRIANTVSAKNLLVYPATGGTVDYGLADAAYTLAGRKHAIFFATSATQWYAIVTA